MNKKTYSATLQSVRWLLTRMRHRGFKLIGYGWEKNAWVMHWRPIRPALPKRRSH